MSRRRPPTPGGQGALFLRESTPPDNWTTRLGDWKRGRARASSGECVLSWRPVLPFSPGESLVLVIESKLRQLLQRPVVLGCQLVHHIAIFHVGGHHFPGVGLHFEMPAQGWML